MSQIPTTRRVMEESIRIRREEDKRVTKLDMTIDVLATIRVEQGYDTMGCLRQYGQDDYTFMGRPVELFAAGDLDAPGWQWRTT